MNASSVSKKKKKAQKKSYIFTRIINNKIFGSNFYFSKRNPRLHSHALQFKFQICKRLCSNCSTMRKALKRSSCNSSSKEQTQKKRKKLDTNNVSIIQQLGQISPFNPQQKSPILNLANPSRFQQLLESESDVVAPQSDCKPSSSVEFNFDVGNANERVFVLSQDLFW